MRHFGLYEPVAQQALESVGTPPWSLEDLDKAEGRITERMCRSIYPNCQPQDVIEWLNRMTEARRRQLVAHLNDEMSRKAS